MMRPLRNSLVQGFLGGVLAIALMMGIPYAIHAATITFSKTFVDGEVLTASDLETMKTNITDVVNAGGGPVTLTTSQTISGSKTLSGTTTISGAATLSSTITLTGNVLGANPIILEGATADANEGTFVAEDFTGDRSFTLPAEDDVDWRKRMVQIVNTITGAVATGTTVMVYDDTIPQIAEGDEYMTLAITPTATANILKIEVVVNLSTSATGTTRMIVGLFQDATGDALAGVIDGIPNEDLFFRNIKFTHWMSAGTTSSTTFRVRAGGSAAGTTSFNGVGGARFLGDVMASSITITEYDTDV